jgi:hypothetical protein
MFGKTLLPVLSFRPFLCLSFLCSLLTAVPAAAWEYAYGPAATSEKGFRRVTPAQFCPAQGLGYVAVGTLDQRGGNPEVYAVYSNLAGAPVWEFSYDVQGLGFPDEGMAVVEQPGSGFVILSNSHDGWMWRIALTQVRCDGTVAWSKLFVDHYSRTGLRGNDLILAGNGDLAVAGLWFNGSDNDAYLLRTTGAGVLLWNAAYGTGGDELFNALTEPIGPNDPVYPDLVAVGRFDKGGGDLQGLVARVDGSNGNIGGAPHCLAQHGAADSDEIYHSVAPLQNPAYAGQLAMTGVTSGQGWLDDVWMTRGNPCTLFAQSRIGNPAGGVTVEQGHDLREVAGPVIGPAGGTLTVAGAYRPIFGFTDAAFLQVASGTLMPLGGSGRTFGGGMADEAFFSLAEDPAGWPQGGFVLAGYTETPWTPGDPGDLYLVHHDPLSPFAFCELGWSPGGIALDWPQGKVGHRRLDPTRHTEVETPAIKHVTALRICP